MRRTRHKLESRWEVGVFLGVKEHTTERIVGNEDGVYVVQSVRRKPESEQYDADSLAKVRGLPWQPNPEQGVALELPEPMPLQPALPEHPSAPAPRFEKEFVHKQHYILKAELDKYGYTASCPACDQIRGGGARRGGVSHTEACRACVEKATAEDPERRHRLEASEMRLV